ncbi:hypothetical protein J2Z83_003229 [Virgibacillus natechei]|uniref:Antigen I/II N-terminal domain-containing protein n=1 Tax=Virgibacillus natechei TaxID=1216297 RepID=A0ABS4IKM7_9BACI|nr:hypothetical protein [Virgibacillus natechei]MBP1971090.1 hypothetical protein [Virgibacillus natechei]UZD12220.1 hypothetical protein OLD84_14975 [Virgibacillus natechei]
MKKLVFIMISFLFILTACGEDNAVEVTLPASFMEAEEIDIDSLTADSEESGIEDVTENSDGSVSYEMSGSKHEEMMTEIESEVNNSIEEIADNEEYASIQDITSSNSFSEFTMLVDQETFENSFDGFAAMALGVSGMFYQLFDGTDADDYAVTISIENADTGEVFDTLHYPEDLDG